MRVFEFRHEWRLRFDEPRVYAALADVDRYPLWWPQIRSINRLDERSGHALVRSLLPYTMDLLLTREVEDPVERVLRVRIDGDLEGWSEWRLEAVSGTPEPLTLVHYTQEARVTATGLSRLVPVSGPVLRANHTWMMRWGELGLRAYLGG